jgi:phosphoenolpyruvate synthase/pyruvate phosphate dikinase
VAYALDLHEIDQTQVATAGGKAANLGELSRIDGIRVPDGFCVTTDAFRRIMAVTPSVADRLDGLARLQPDDREAIAAHCADVRRAIEATPIPDDLAAAITGAHARLGEQGAYAVRSSATAEDLPSASFAGQQDSYLGVAGPQAILEHVSRCWASLFTDRAVSYRLRNGFDHRSVSMAVVVQRMVDAEAAGTLFTADPVTSNRRVVSIEAVLGLGEALVSGRTNADTYAVRDGELVTKAIAGERPALSDAQAVRLAQLGRRIEAHFGRPQDVEWCLAGEEISVVQSRAITTLFPIPPADDGENHVYISVGHQQMMTDAMKPLGLSLWQLTTPRPMAEAGGRLFVDVTQLLASPEVRPGFVGAFLRSDPLIGDALQSIVDRGDYVRRNGAPVTAPPGAAPSEVETDPSVPGELIAKSRTSIAECKRAIQGKSGPELLDFILDDIAELKRILFDPQSRKVIMAGMESAWWLNQHMEEWLGEKNAVDAIAQSVPNNVTSEMGLALLDVADAVRPHPDVVAFLQRVEDGDVPADGFLDALETVEGGREARDAVLDYLERYGMRCPGEIDVTKPRWSERPAMLVPAILGHVRNSAPGESARRFEQGRQASRAKEQDLLERLRALPDGEQKAAETKQMIDRVRDFAGYREYPKYGKQCRDFVYKQALMQEAGRLVRAGVIREEEDIFFLRLEELRDVVQTGHADGELIAERREAFRWYETLTPPRVLTSDGETLGGAYRRDDVPAGALPGLPVSAGTIEGRARVITDMAQAELEAGDILVTRFTDPGWTPLFVAIEGLVTEVGGQMTHGAVIAREYGLPAVVGVEHATRLIEDGQRIRVHGSEGYVEILA